MAGGKQPRIDLDLMRDVREAAQALGIDHLLHLITQGFLILELEEKHVPDPDAAFRSDRKDPGAGVLAPGGVDLGVSDYVSDSECHRWNSHTSDGDDLMGTATVRPAAGGAR